MNRQEIQVILAEEGVHPDSIELNPAADGEWVVWYGMGFPVYTADDVYHLARRLDEMESY